ncbi:MAG: carbohydrate-binding domain-containing protein [Bacteroidaceae bacterium]|nr:carbohydrate-binding domain-containing protein [Bacteroidaceae bacterium]
MKKLFIISTFMLCACAMQAQEQIRIWKGDTSVRFTTSELTFEKEGRAIIVGDSVYAPAEVDSIKVVHTVTVTFAGDTAYVDRGHAKHVTDTIVGAHVKLVSTDTQNELEFVLQGESTHGSLLYEGPLKCKFYLNGLNLKSDVGAAINIQCGKRVNMILNPGTQNYLSDYSRGTQKAALYCKGHLEIEGSGSLTVTGNARHGIATKEYLQLKRTTGTITVNRAASDAVHAGQYFLMNGGTLTLTGQSGDGLQVEKVTLDDDVTPDPTKENNGLMFIRGGSITITAEQDITKGIKVPENLYVSGGTFNITANGDGSRGIQVAGNMTVDEEYNTTLMQIRANGTTYEDEETDDEDRCIGIKVKGNLSVNAGTIQVSNKGKYSYGIKVDGVYTKSPNATVQANVKN